MPTRTARALAASARVAAMAQLPHDPHGVAVILTPLAALEDATDAQAARAWADFEAFVLGGLRGMWTPSAGQRQDGADVLARSRLHLLTLTVTDDGAAHVCVTRRRGLGATEAELAARTLEATAGLIFERLATRWALSIRTGPYTTAPWRRET